MRKKKILFSVLGLGALFTLASCGDNSNSEEIEKLKQEITQLKEENESLTNDKEALTNENNTLKNDNETKTKELNSLNKEVSKLGQNCDFFSKEYGRLKGENKKIWEDISNVLKEKSAYAIKYTNPLGKSIIKAFDTSDHIDSALTDEFNANITSSSYGSYVRCFNNYVDPNWYVAIYENGEYSSVGLNGLEADAGDVFEFKYECWNTVESGGILDSYDVLVDQAIYNYYDDVFLNKALDIETYSGNLYWDAMALNKYKEHSDSYLLNSCNNLLFTNECEAEIAFMNYDTLTGNNLFKYYYVARIKGGCNSDKFKTKYQSYLDTLDEYPAYGEYSIPFHTGVAKTLGLQLNDAIKNTTYKPDLTYGPEGLAWQLTGLACYNTLTKSDLSALTFDALDNPYIGSKDVALSTYMLPYAAANISFRELKTADGEDAIQYLFNHYFDLDTFKFETEKLDNDISSNQIYAGLVAYKFQRDTNSATNLFE